MRVVLGVTGGIAAYKAAEIVRQLQDRGVEVQVVMTRHAREFVAPLTFAALSGRKVITEMFAAAEGQPNVDSAIEHIAVAEGIEAVLIAPATANVLAKIAHGIADDFLTTLCLATKAPIIVAPAMNVNMWENAVTQQNVQVLRSRGVKVIDPDEGYLACGMTGAGRLASVEAIVHTIAETLGIRDDLKGETVLVTAGRTDGLTLSRRKMTPATETAKRLGTRTPRYRASPRQVFRDMRSTGQAANHASAGVVRSRSRATKAAARPTATTASGRASGTFHVYSSLRKETNDASCRSGFRSGSG